MQEYICPKCGVVFEGGIGKHCGIDSELFSLERHGRRLISSSNSWISVWEKWKDNQFLSDVSDDLINDGSYGAATHINVFIERLLDRAGIDR
jgi:hypothetical protein